MAGTTRRAKVAPTAKSSQDTRVDTRIGATDSALPAIVPAFARHETFHPRYGWVKKGFDKAGGDSKVFLRHDAPIVLGVGKNMVRAIRYWCHATKVLDDASEGRGTGSVPSEFGSMLLGPSGVDEYLEDLGSLWLLHWQLLSPPCIATAWHFAFSVFARQTFSVDELTTGLAEYVERVFPTARLATSSLRKDVTCILRMYGQVVPSVNGVGEDSIQCPFAELTLLRTLGDKSFSFNMGAKPGLSFWLVAATALQFCARSGGSARTISLSTLLNSPSGPGMVFKLTESALYAALEGAATKTNGLSLTDAAGLIQLSFNDDPSMIANALIRRHFDAARAGKAVA